MAVRKAACGPAPPMKLFTNFARGISARGANGRSVEGYKPKRRVTTKGLASPVPIPPPPDPGSGPAGPAIFGYFPSLESNPPEAGPENENHQSTEEEAEWKRPPTKRAPATAPQGATKKKQKANKTKKSRLIVEKSLYKLL